MKEVLQNSPISCAFFTIFMGFEAYGALISGSILGFLVCGIFSLIWFAKLVDLIRKDA